MKNFISGLKVVDSIERPIKIYCDNSATTFFSKNNKSGSRTKHIDIKYLVVREHIKKQLVSIEHIDTESMVADPLTKGLSAKMFQNHVIHMGLSVLY